MVREVSKENTRNTEREEIEMNSVKAAGLGGGVAFLSMGDLILALVISGVILIIFALLYKSFYSKVEDKMVKSAESLLKDIKERAGKMKKESTTCLSQPGPPT